MPTLWSQTLIPTLRNVPAEAEVPSHQLMLRAGLIRKLGAGLYDYLPLGLRSLHKVMAIIRQEMAAAGAAEVFLPALVPLELYQQTGRDVAYGDNLFRLKDRHGRINALGPTHEEVVTELVGASVESYKQLPLTLYQIQTKFRDEFRPRFGVLRSREFQMKDAYSFHTALEGPGGLNETYQKQYDAYCRIFARCGLPYVTVEAESGPIGGSASHEFMVVTPTGEDTILESDKGGSGGYAANVEKCEIGPRPVGESFRTIVEAQGMQSVSFTPAQPPKGELTKVHTPNCPGIDDVSVFMKVKPKNMLKTLVFQPEPHGEQTASQPQRFVVAVVRGDHEVNDGKLKAAVGGPITLADQQKARDAGFAIGFVGPQSIVGRGDVTVFIDPDASIDQFWVTGSNEIDHHVKHFDWMRDFLDPMRRTIVSEAPPTSGPATVADASRSPRSPAGPETYASKVRIADIRNAVDGDPSPRNDGGVLRAKKGIEVGHVFKLGDKYTKAMNVTVLLADQSRMHPIMGCYGIGCNRILAAAIERPGGHDADGIVWPSAIAPYQVVITPIRYDGRAREVALQLSALLEASGVDVLIDDRDERPGVKFKDADLLGFPVRVTLGDKALAQNMVEIKARAPGKTAPKGDLVPIDQAAARIAELLAE